MTSMVILAEGGIMINSFFSHCNTNIDVLKFV